MPHAFFLVAALFLGVATPLLAQPTQAGAYVTEGGWGKLQIQADGTFALESTGANGHQCNVEGKIESATTWRSRNIAQAARRHASTR